MPLPIPFSVICSPNHIKNNVPVANLDIDFHRFLSMCLHV
jgi:hypothetical protein